MFYSDPSLFMSASNSINIANTILNSCIMLLSTLSEYDYNNCKSDVDNCEIDILIDKVETAKKNLIETDESFAHEYRTLLEDYLKFDNIDVSNMSDAERMQYSIIMDACNRDYNYTLLYMLEKYAENEENLTDELKLQLDRQRLIVEQYEIQDEMARISITRNRSLELFNRNAEINRKLINSNPDLTDEEKKKALDEYEESYRMGLEILKNKQIKASESEYQNACWLEKGIHQGLSFLYSGAEGVLNVGEKILDTVVLSVAKAGNWGFGIDTEWAEDFTTRDLSGEWYFNTVSEWNLYENVAYGTAHVVGNFVGETAAILSLQALPGAGVVVANGAIGMGAAAEYALQSGASFNDSYNYGLLVGGIDALSSYFLYSDGKQFLSEISAIQKSEKIAIAGAKEVGKEFASVIIDGEFDVDKAADKAFESMARTSINEFVVTPIFDWVRTSSQTGTNNATVSENATEELQKLQDEIINNPIVNSIDATGEVQALLNEINNSAIVNSVILNEQALEVLKTYLVKISQKATTEIAFDTMMDVAEIIANEEK